MPFLANKHYCKNWCGEIFNTYYCKKCGKYITDYCKSCHEERHARISEEITRMRREMR